VQNNKAHRAIWGLPANDKTKIIVEKSIFKNNEITANNGNDFTTNHGALIWFEKFTKGRFEIISSQFIDNKFDPRFGVGIDGYVLLASVLWLQPLDNDSEYDLILENNSIVSNEGLTYAPISLYLDRDVVSKNNYASNNDVTCGGIWFLNADMDPESRTCDLKGFKQTSDPPTKVPTKDPTKSITPTKVPTKSITPTKVPTSQPSSVPSTLPSTVPSILPSMIPSSNPSAVPSNKPSVVPSIQPSLRSSSLPSVLPSLKPSSLPSSLPSVVPSSLPSASPSPSTLPSVVPKINLGEKRESAASLSPSIISSFMLCCLSGIILF